MRTCLALLSFDRGIYYREMVKFISLLVLDLRLFSKDPFSGFGLELASYFRYGVWGTVVPDLLFEFMKQFIQVAPLSYGFMFRIKTLCKLFEHSFLF